MVKKSKRKQDIKSKLMAAIAMLMVATIMMVSSTYAWFTLSTAPEIQGITTTVGSNGSLEIALSPASGNGTDVKDADLETGASWYDKNLTWGNLLDFTDGNRMVDNQSTPYSYNLDDIVLLPAALAGTAAQLNTNPLATPSYGSDGRINGLSKNTFIGGQTGLNGKFVADSGDYGVRAVGTSSSMTPQERAYRLSLASIKDNMEAARSNASKALGDNGQALATIMVLYAQNSDAVFTSEEITGVKNLVDSLDDSVKNLEAALLAYLRVLYIKASENLTTEAFNTGLAAFDMYDLTKAEEAIQGTLGENESLPTDYTTAYNTYISIKNDVKTAADAEIFKNNITNETTAKWEDLDDVLNVLMNTNGVKVNGMTKDELVDIMDNYDELIKLATNTNITLGEGSGVFYDIASMAGNFSAKTSAKVYYNGDAITLPNVFISTEFSGTPQLQTLHTDASAYKPETDAAAVEQVLDVYYGYVLDFVFRTNASGSYLKLQTDGTQRIYGDDETSNTDTMGDGSTFVFTTREEAKANTLIEMCKSLRVVFFNPDSNAIYGMAMAVNAGDVTSVKDDTGEKETDDEGNEVVIYEYTVTAKLSLCQIEEKDGDYLAGKNLAKADSDTTDQIDDSDKLVDLPQNTAVEVSALVYLDGYTISNADVLNDGDVSGKLNLQFASSADLKPMENADLINGTNPATPTT